MRQVLRELSGLKEIIFIEEIADGAGTKRHGPKRFAIRAQNRTSGFEAKCIGAECELNFAFLLMATVPGLKASKLPLAISRFPLDAFRHFDSHEL